MSEKWMGIHSEGERGVHESERVEEREIRGGMERANKSRREIENDMER